MNLFECLSESLRESLWVSLRVSLSLTEMCTAGVRVDDAGGVPHGEVRPAGEGQHPPTHSTGRHRIICTGHVEIYKSTGRHRIISTGPCRNYSELHAHIQVYRPSPDRFYRPM